MTAELAPGLRTCADTLRYADYLRTDLILAAQHPRSAMVLPEIHDEHFFIVLHQSQELWFKQMLYEMGAILKLDGASSRFFFDALPKLERIAAIETALVQQLELLRTLDPGQFLQMRPLLGTASGGQSCQFRLVEATAGVSAAAAPRPDLAMLTDDERERVRSAMQSPSVHEALVVALDHEWTRRQAADAIDPATVAAWERQLRYAHLLSTGDAPAPLNGSASSGFTSAPPAALMMALQAQAETSATDRAINATLQALCQFEEQMVAWRSAHAAIVRDLMDELPGTGGTAGYAYLRANTMAQPRSSLYRLLRPARSMRADTALSPHAAGPRVPQQGVGA